MKKLLLGVLLLFSYSVNSQTIVYEDDFETNGTFIMGSTATNQWTINNIYTGLLFPTVPVQPVSFSSPNGNYLHPISTLFAGTIDHSNYQLPDNGQMIAVMTSQLDLSNYNSTEISFWRTGGSEGLKVIYSINNGPWQDAYTVTGVPTTWQQESFSLPAVDGLNNVRIGFEFDGTAALDPAPNQYHSIDELSVTATLISGADQITADVTNLTYCGDDQIDVTYDVVTGTINTANIYTLELSDATGSFASATNIGSLTSTNTTGTITGTIPNGLSGSGFRVRVNSDDDPITGTQNNADITINTLPTVNAGAAQAVCEGEEVTLTATNPNGASISWDNNVTDNTPFTPTTTQTYTVTADNNGCTATDNVEVVVNPTPSVDAGMNQTICDGEEVTISATNPNGATISWDNGISDNTPFIPTMTQTYTVTADLNGCTATDAVEVTVNPIPSNPTITLNGNNDLEVSISGGQTVEWYLDGVLINGQNGVTLTPTSNGDYTAIIVDGGCSSGESSSFVVDFVDLIENDFNPLSIYPNPASELVNISSPQAIDAELIITDINGRSVFMNTFNSNIQVDISKLESGIYFVKVYNQEKSYKLIKR
jgi:nitrate reductase cytochrome c-type subunit